MRARRHSIVLPDGRDFAICIAADETDDVATSIARGTYVIPAHYRLLEALLPHPGLVVDLGAHIGTFALYAAALGHEVVAVEASAQPRVAACEHRPQRIRSCAARARRRERRGGLPRVHRTRRLWRRRELHLFDQDPATLLQRVESAGFRSWEIHEGHLIPARQDGLQFACVVDYVGLKRPAEWIDGWAIDPPRSLEQEIDLAIAVARDANPHIRAHIGRALAGAVASLVSDRRIDATLRDLSRDPEQEVRESVAWFSVGSR